jgi:SWI/SNF-related matrix-associated actin-dependent regulator of chromatin subfamily A member 5
MDDYYFVFGNKWKQLAGMLFGHPSYNAGSYFSVQSIPESSNILWKARRRQTVEPRVFSIEKDCIRQISYARAQAQLSHKVFNEEEDRYLLCRLNYHGMTADDVCERIKKDTIEFPVFWFDWFFKSRSLQGLQRRCNMLLGMIEKVVKVKQREEIKAQGGARGKLPFFQLN